jgi:uncharacterized membrane protein (UPF0127 family)
MSRMQVGRIYCGQELLVEHAWRADTALTRARGLLGRPPLQTGQGLVITPCSSIHTFGMQYDLDIVFLDFADRIVKLVCHLGKWRMAMSARARWTLELRAGEAARLNLKLGDELNWRQD